MIIATQERGCHILRMPDIDPPDMELEVMGKGLSGIQSIIDGVAITTQVNSDQTPLM